MESNVLRQLGATTAWPMFPMYEWLLDVDAKSGKSAPMLATAWSLEPDGASYRFQLRKGVKFHGDWGEFSAQDFQAAVAEKTRPDAGGQEQSVRSPRYGTGYEARQRNTAAESGTGFGGPGSGLGAGMGGGRGMGRGR